MPDAVTLGLFLTTALALLVIPGPAVLYVVASSVQHGRLVGIASVLGVATGGLAHVAGAALGISAILVGSAGAFTVVKLLGAGYLVWLGARLIVTGGRSRTPAGPRRTRSVSTWDAYRQGIVVNLLNPKVALFFLAFLPQFVDTRRGSALVQTLVLGVAFLALGVVTDGAYALLAGTIAAVARRRVRAPALGPRLAGAVYVGLGVTAAFTRRDVAATG